MISDGVKLLRLLKQELLPVGINMFGVLRPSTFNQMVARDIYSNDILVGTRAIVIVASGGRKFFESFRATHVDPGTKHPLDTYTRNVLRGATAYWERVSGVRTRSVFPFFDETPVLPFVRLGEAARIGAQSLLGILLHPRFGPWIAFRGAIFVDHELPFTDSGRFDLRFREIWKSPNWRGPARAAPCAGCPAFCGVGDLSLAEVVHLPATEFAMARRKCVYGRSNAHSKEQQEFHLAALGCSSNHG